MTTTHDSPFARFAEDEEPTTESPFARFSAGEDGETEDSGETTEKQETKREPLDPEEFRNRILLYTLQVDTSTAIGSFVKTQKEETVTQLIEQASQDFGTDQFVVRAPTVDGDEEELAKITVNRTKPSTSLTSPKALLGWAVEHRPEVTETRKRISPHVDPKVMDAVFAFLEEHHPEAVEEVTDLKPNAADVILANARFEGEDVVVDAETIDPATGEVAEAQPQVVPGLRHHKGGEFKSFTMTRGGKGQPNQKKALRLLSDRKIAGTDFREVMAGALAQLEAKK